MLSSLPRSSPCYRSPRGFALLITITLLAFLVLLLVSLASLTRVETQVASNAQQLVSARQNALFGLNVAMGQLQQLAGPDQRVTARADIRAGTHASKSNWTGVWNVSGLAANPDTPISSASPSITPTWLVSTPDPATLPDNTTAAPTLAATANYDDTAAVVRLVGSGSVDTSVTGNEIVVPLQEIKAPALGLGANPVTIGKFGYWVGDEGVKARINLDSPAFKTGATATQAAYAFAGAPRAAIESMERTASPTSGTVTSAWTTSLYPYADPTTPMADSVAKLSVRDQLPFYALSGNATATQTAAKARFHDLTAHSASVLANTVNGGLRQDLTRILTATTPAAQPVGTRDADPIFPAASVSPAPTEIQCLPPTWGRLRYWWNNPIDPATGSLTPTLRTSTTPSIAPVVMWAELGLAFFAENIGAGTYRIRVQAFPRAILWNPYTVPMAGGTYELGFTGNSGPIDLENIPPTTTPPTPPTPVGTFSLAKYGFNTSGSSRDLRFTVTVTQPLAPGQAKVFSFNVSGDTTLKEGDFPANYMILNTLANIDYKDTAVPPPYRINNANVPGKLGGSNGFYLRASGVPASSPSYTNPYQWAPGIGTNQPNISGAAPTIDLPSVGSVATSPHLRVINTTEMIFSGVYYRWLANNNNIGVVLSSHPNDPSNTFFRSAVVSPTNSTLPSTASGDVPITTKLSSTPSPSSLTLREPRLPDAGLYQSIAQLQHAPVNDTGCGALNAVGNSLINARIPRQATYVTASPTSTYSLVTPLYDISYLLNQALWDSYFFSTVPTFTAANLATPLPNARLKPLASASVASLNNYTTTAANLMLLGGFNINSTSEQAWRAVLGAAQNLKYNPVTGALAPSGPLLNPFSRFSKPLGDSTDRYRGYRQLTDAQIASLAARMVDEVKKRGPFRSLADFVNRRLIVSTDPASATGLKGAVQAAIDYADWDSTPAKQINNIIPYTTDIYGRGFGANDQESWSGVPGATNAGKAPTSSRHAFGPGYVSQADVLSRIGSAISARSDTFVIRTYGETRNPATGQVDGRAWCEAVVQRTPNYVDPAATAPEATPTAGTPNATFGRRFTVVSFRWLGPNDI